MVSRVKEFLGLATKAEWTTKYVNDLPDSAFLYIAPGGDKDQENKTVPRSLRYFPYKDATGKVDLPHLRNALARIPQANVPQGVKDRATARARSILEQASKELWTGSLTVVQQKDGTYRWFARSSNAYEDNEGEILSTKALQEATNYMNNTQDYGPLRWWHVGTDSPSEGINIGTTDFSAIHGRMLIESGTFKDAVVARAMMQAAPKMAISIGFKHPINEPDSQGVFHNVRVFERSVLPKQWAANPYTAFGVIEEKPMASIKEKWQEFLSLFGGDEAKAKEYVSASSDVQKEIETQGVRAKEQETPPTPAPAPTPTVTDEKAKPKPKAEEPQSPAEETPKNPIQGMPFEQVQQIVNQYNQLLQSITGVAQEVKETGSRIDLQVAAVKEANGKLETALKSLQDMDTRIKTLEGDADIPGKQAYRASKEGDAPTTLKEQQPYIDPIALNLLSGLYNQNQGQSK